MNKLVSCESMLHIGCGSLIACVQNELHSGVRDPELVAAKGVR